jgi:hypothetical protein
MLATVKAGEAASRRDLRVQLVTERLTGVPEENGYTNAAMEWGVRYEAEALAVYEARTGALVTTVGFCEHDTLAAGTSPDALVGREGSVSVKCPLSSTHLSYLRDGGEPSAHAAQNTHELWLCERPWLDFVSYDPRMPEGLQVFCVRVTRTPAELADYERKVRAFLAECDVEEQALRTMANLGGTLREAAHV